MRTDTFIAVLVCSFVYYCSYGSIDPLLTKWRIDMTKWNLTLPNGETTTISTVEFQDWGFIRHTISDPENLDFFLKKSSFYDHGFDLELTCEIMEFHMVEDAPQCNGEITLDDDETVILKWERIKGDDVLVDESDFEAVEDYFIQQFHTDPTNVALEWATTGKSVETFISEYEEAAQ